MKWGTGICLGVKRASEIRDSLTEHLTDKLVADCRLDNEDRISQAVGMALFL